MFQTPRHSKGRIVHWAGLSPRENRNETFVKIHIVLSMDIPNVSPNIQMLYLTTEKRPKLF